MVYSEISLRSDPGIAEFFASLKSGGSLFGFLPGPRYLRWLFEDLGSCRPGWPPLCRLDCEASVLGCVLVCRTALLACKRGRFDFTRTLFFDGLGGVWVCMAFPVLSQYRSLDCLDMICVDSTVDLGVGRSVS